MRRPVDSRLKTLVAIPHTPRIVHGACHYRFQTLLSRRNAPQAVAQPKETARSRESSTLRQDPGRDSDSRDYGSCPCPATFEAERSPSECRYLDGHVGESTGHSSIENAAPTHPLTFILQQIHERVEEL